MKNQLVGDQQTQALPHSVNKLDLPMIVTCFCSTCFCMLVTLGEVLLYEQVVPGSHVGYFAGC